MARKPLWRALELGVGALMNQSRCPVAASSSRSRTLPTTSCCRRRNSCSPNWQAAGRILIGAAAGGNANGENKMVTFKLAELPSELNLRIPPEARAEGDAIYLSLGVYDVKNPDDLKDFHICLDKKAALQLAADLVEAAQEII
jgi:hypothetical protein